MNFIDRFPVASATGVFTSVGFEDLKPIALVILAFIVDTSLKYIHKRFNQNDDNS